MDVLQTIKSSSDGSVYLRSDTTKSLVHLAMFSSGGALSARALVRGASRDLVADRCSCQRSGVIRKRIDRPSNITPVK